MESESHTIGKVSLPLELWNNMQDARGIEIIVPEKERIHHILNDYGKFSKPELIQCVQNIRRRLGDEDCNKVIQMIVNNDLHAAVERLLKYYDKSYAFGRIKRNCQDYVKLSFENLSPDKIARILLQYEDKIHENAKAGLTNHL